VERRSGGIEGLDQCAAAFVLVIPELARVIAGTRVNGDNRTPGPG
jgi:hypothetical protein